VKRKSMHEKWSSKVILVDVQGEDRPGLLTGIFTMTEPGLQNLSGKTAILRPQRIGGKYGGGGAFAINVRDDEAVDEGGERVNQRVLCSDEAGRDTKSTGRERINLVDGIARPSAQSKIKKGGKRTSRASSENSLRRFR